MCPGNPGFPVGTGPQSQIAPVRLLKTIDNCFLNALTHD